MFWETVRNVGHLYKTDTLINGLGIKNARSFLQSMMKDFATTCVNYYDVTDEFPFIFRERQINSVLLPAIAKVSDAVIMEQPIRRGEKQTSTHGWLDYWVLYGSTVFLIELKHAWCSATSGRIRKVTQEAWTEAIKQINSIQSVEELGLSTKYTMVKIAMTILIFYLGSVNIENLYPFDKEKIETIHSSTLNGLNPSPNWSCIWLLHERLQNPVKYASSYELYPCVGIVAQVDNSLSIKG